MIGLDDLIGESPGIRAVRQKIGQLLSRQTDVRRLPPFLLQGETGTGKGLLARAIHRAGPRKDGPFVDVNCAAIPDTLLEAEMFGFERGAFTDARQAKMGLFQAAHRGTIFLDEIGLLPEPLQAKLLKVLEEQAVRRLGSTKSEPVDVWILAATSEDLAQAARARRFREDLYHRLAVLTVALPPLRERGPDVLLLAEHFLARACQDYRLPPKAFDPAARHALLAYPWPGNIRELANVMERVALLAEAPVVTAEMLGLSEAAAAETAVTPAETPIPLEDAVGSVERAHLLEALRQTNRNISRAATLLGISRNTLRYRMEKYGLRPGGPPASRRRVERGVEPAVSAGVPPEVSASPPVRAAPPSVRWEQRRLTLLRADLVPPRQERLPTDASRQLEIFIEKVQIFSGRIEELGVMGIVAVFGLEPVEDAPRRAVLSALAIQKAVEHARQDHEPLAVKIGVHVGQFLVGYTDGAAKIDLDAKRHTWMVLEALVAAAEPDSLVVSEPAASLLERRFDLVPLGVLEPLAGKAYRLVGRERAGLGPGGRMTRFVGRRHELELLQNRLASVMTGKGQVVGVVGDPGIGKSRLLYEFRQALEGKQVAYLEGRCVSYGSTTPYLPVLDIVRMSAGITESDTPEATVEKVRAGLIEAGMNLAEASPYLLHLLGIKEGTERVAMLSPEVVKVRIFETLRQMMLRWSQQRPLIIAVKDLHWIDDISEKYFVSLSEVVPGARILVVSTYRPGYQPPWMDKSYATQVALQPLTLQESASIVRAVLGTVRIPSPIAQLILSKAEGNPFFLEELARAVRDKGNLSPSEAVPDTIEEVIMARLDRLLPEQKRLLQIAAVIGKDVPSPFLRATSDLPDQELRRAIMHLQAAEFLYERSVAPELEYTFKHTLTQEVVYQSLLKDQRCEIHAQIVDAIERLYPDRLSEHVERLADHAFRGEAWEKALRYLREAGTKAAARSAHRDAAIYFEHALLALKHLPESRERLEQAIDLHFLLRTSLLPLGELKRILECLRQTEALATTLGDQQRLGRLSAYMTNYFFLIGNQDRALEYGERALSIGMTLGDFALQSEMNYRLGQIYHTRGDHRQARDTLKKSVEAIRGDLIHERFGLPVALSIVSRNWFVRVLAALGEFGEGIARGEEALRIAESANHPIDLIVALQGAGHLYLSKGDMREAISVLERGLDLCREWTVPIWFPMVASTLGSAYALSERGAEALPLLELAVERHASMGRMGGHSLWVGWLSEAHLLAGQREEASRLAARALDLSRAHRERGHEAWALRLIGEIGSRGDVADLEAAHASYRQALTMAEELLMRPLAARCHLGLGRSHRQTGNRSAAETYLTRAISLLREMNMHFWLQQAERELKEL